MKIIVIVNETFPTDQNLTLENINEKKILNPYDEFAIQKASEIKNTETNEIIIFMISKSDNLYCLKTCLGLGGTSGNLIIFKGNNPKDLASILVEEIKKQGTFDLILTGEQDVNNPRGDIPYMMNSLLDIPLISHCLDINYSNNKLICKKETDDFLEEISINLPCIISFRKNVYEPKYPSINDIMSINEKPIFLNYYNKSENNLYLKLKIYNVKRQNKIYKNIDSDKAVKKISTYLDEWGLNGGLYEYINLFKSKK